jgi:hypothetical protein
VGRRLSKGKNPFIKNNITGYVNAACKNVKTFVTLMKITVPKKNIVFRTKLKLMRVVGA